MPNEDSEKPAKVNRCEDNPLDDAIGQARQYLQTPRVKKDLDRLNWLTVYLDLWAEQAHNQNAAEAFQLARDVLNVARNALVCEAAPRAEDRAIAVVMAKGINRVTRELEKLGHIKDESLAVHWVVTVLNSARDYGDVCTAISARAKAQPRPILATEEHWRSALKNWPDAKVKHPIAPHRPHFIVAKLLYPRLTAEKLRVKAQGLLRNHRDAFLFGG